MRIRRRVHRPADGPALAPGTAPTERAPDDTDLGWGDRDATSAGENDARLLEDRPPHHDGRTAS